MDADRGTDPIGQRRLQCARGAAVEQVELDVLAGTADLLEFEDQRLPLVWIAIAGQERHGRAGWYVHSPGREDVEGTKCPPIDRRKCPHRPPPTVGRAVACESGEEAQQSRVCSRRYVHRRCRHQDSPQAVAQYGRLRQRRSQARGEPAGVAPGRSSGHPDALDHCDLDPALLQKPGSGQADHTGADNRHPPGRARPAAGSRALVSGHVRHTTSLLARRGLRPAGARSDDRRAPFGPLEHRPVARRSTTLTGHVRSLSCGR